MSVEPGGLIGPVTALIATVANDIIVAAQATSTLLTGKDEPVTQVDIDAEAVLSAGLRRLLPVAVIGEEAAKGVPGAMKALGAPGAVWLVDPIDGTGNYAAGTNEFGTMVALVVDGETRAAWIWSRRDDAVFTATVGDGVRRDGVSVDRRVDGPPARGQLLDRFMDDHLADNIRNAIGSVRLVDPTCCAAVDYPAIVEGRLDFSIYGRVRPWDHAAGALLVSEAGGNAQHLDGGVYRPSREAGGLVVSANATTRSLVADPISRLSLR